ncbi:ParB/RepB/Spo0J family partition protein [Actinokineospora fastidiosa]|uniref:ParB-like N-terminal domain-containing protein n=1 Tax=Actinokineospora fastidiosa TaxID=1816 RepID=A0A918GKX3_9PSEU|nr:ParB/RepB/Spo0J family partition protein [Actinokineospora fastidiosa]GGS44975.1 hypothetical protein GCM10010171_44860 [Actinokineospora fastidiosa]
MSTRLALLADTAVKVPVKTLLDADSPRLAGIDESHAQLLAALHTSLPPIIAHRDTMRVIDGMHRLRAAIIRGDDAIEARFFEGSEKDAFVVAVEANVGHGLPLTMSDRMAAAKRIVRTHPEWSDRAIATASGVAAKVVAAMRCASADIPHLHTRIGRDGRVRPLDSAAGRRLAGDLLRENPQASLREIVRAANISLGTARDVRERLRRGEDPVLPRQRDARDRRRRPAPEPKVIGSVNDGDRGRVAGDMVSVLRRLRTDPSLRFSEDGRFLLRLLDVHAIDADTWKRLTDNTPPHCLRTVAELAEGCADVWRRFADQLKQYQRESA